MKAAYSCVKKRYVLQGSKCCAAQKPAYRSQANRRTRSESRLSRRLPPSAVCTPPYAVSTRPEETNAAYSEYLVCLSRLWRADERTRTAFLLITSDTSRVAGGCTGLQFPHFDADSIALGCWALHRIVFPVVSGWCQCHPSPVRAGGCRLPTARRAWTAPAHRLCIGRSSSGPPSRRLTTRTPRRPHFSQISPLFVGQTLSDKSTGRRTRTPPAAPFACARASSDRGCANR